MGRIARLCRSRRARSIAALGCILLILVAANIVAARWMPERIDLTEERLYTLSRGTEAMLARIDEPITLRFYYSPGLGEAVPAYAVYAERVRQLLRQYAAAAHGKLRLEIYRPEPFSPEEDRAVAFGLQGLPLNSAGEDGYFGLAGTNSTDDQQVIPFFDPERERLLEYDLTRVVHNLVFPKRTVVGLLSTLPLQRDGAGPGQDRDDAMLQQLKQLDDVERLPQQITTIPAGVDVLLLVHPHDLPPATLYAVDQFVLRGGKAVVFVDPYSEVAGRGGASGVATASTVPSLFKAWGLETLPDTVAADRRSARRVGVPAANGGSETLDYVAWLTLSGTSLNHDDPITADLRRIAMATAGILEPLKGASTSFEPLVSTSTDAMKLPAAKVAGLPDVAGLLTRFTPDNRRYVLAAHITGPAATAFPNGPPMPAPGREPLKRSVQPINVVVVADTDMLDDRFWAQSQDAYGREATVALANNGDFVANAVDVLAGGVDLVGLRSRGTSVRPFELVEHIQREADARYAAEQQALERKLKETQARLRELTRGEPKEAKAALAPEQVRAIAQFRADMLATRRQLRSVQAALRQNIEHLKQLLEFLDIAFVPILVAAAALVLSALRRRRWRDLAAAPAAAGRRPTTG